jgi:hypothetical protein
MEFFKTVNKYERFYEREIAYKHMLRRPMDQQEPSKDHVGFGNYEITRKNAQKH